MSDPSGKVVLLTGASGGIGTAAAARLGQAGAAVIAHHLGAADRVAAAAAVATLPPDRRHLLAADLGAPDAADRLWRDAVAWRGRIDAVVLNAGILMEGAIEDDDAAWDAAWSAQLAVNTLGPARLMRQAVRHWRERDSGGVLVTISSWAGQRGSINSSHLAYAASKAALRAAAQTVARGYADKGILSYVIAPGIVDTAMSDQAASAAPPGTPDPATQLPMGRRVRPDEIGDLIAYLAGGGVASLSGATLDVNGAAYIR